MDTSHDKAFGQGFITVTKDYRIWVFQKVKNYANDDFTRTCLVNLEGSKFEGIVVYKTDQFARNKYDSAIYKRQFRNNGIQIYYAAESIPDEPEGIILESLMEGIAEYYSAELAQKIKRGMHESALECRVLGNTMPLGYQASKEPYL